MLTAEVEALWWACYHIRNGDLQAQGHALINALYFLPRSHETATQKLNMKEGDNDTGKKRQSPINHVN